MGLGLENLDAGTRKQILAEIERDIAAGQLYLSTRFSPKGREDYPDLLRAAAAGHDEEWLAQQLRVPGRLQLTEVSHSKTGKEYLKSVPITAADTFAEGEFNRFYLRGLCLRAIADGITEIEVYRAKAVMDPRPESEALIGRRYAPAALLADLRAHTGVEAALGLARPNSGLSGRIPKNGSDA